MLISAGNAIIRKVFNISSNGFLEIQWYLFAGVFLLGAGFAFMRNVHVRIDFISGKLSKRTNAIIDILGIVVFIIPLCLIMVWLSWPLFSTALATGEMSQNAGGLIRWPAYLLMPLGFGLLLRAGAVRADQAHRLPEGPARRADERRSRARATRKSSPRNWPPRPPRSWPEPDAMETSFIAQNFVPLMFAALFVFLLSGIPVAFGLAATGLFFGFIGMEAGLFGSNLFQALPLRVFGIMQNDTLLAIPFFTLMGIILERSGMAEDLLETVGQVFGPVRGGLAIAVILVGALLAATTGVVAAAVISMGLISLPIMLRYGYNRTIATGTITASGTLAQAIPPSLVLIVLADQLGRSVGDMYAGALIPGLMLVGLYLGFVALVAVFKPKWVPALPAEARIYREANGASGHRSLLVLFAGLRRRRLCLVEGAPERDQPAGRPPAAGAGRRDLHHVDDGGVAAGAGAGAGQQVLQDRAAVAADRAGHLRADPAAGADLPGAGHHLPGHRHAHRRRRDGRAGRADHGRRARQAEQALLIQALDNTAKLSCFVLFILIGSTVFSFTFNAADGHIWVEHLFDNMPGGAMGFLIVVNILVFILGCFIDFFEIAFIVIPILAPVAEKILPELLPAGTPPDMTLIWFGVIIAMNLQTSFLTPPFGFALFYLRSVAAKKDYKDRVTGELIPAVETSADLQGLDRLHQPAADDGGGGDRLPDAGDRRHRAGGADRCRQGAGVDERKLERGARRHGRCRVGGARMPPAASGAEGGSEKEDPMKGLLDSMKADAGQEALSSRPGLRRPALKTTSPAEAGLCSCLQIGAPGAPCRSELLRLHEVVEAALGEAEPQVLVAAEVGVVVVDLLPRRVAGAQLAVQRHAPP